MLEKLTSILDNLIEVIKKDTSRFQYSYQNKLSDTAFTIRISNDTQISIDREESTNEVYCILYFDDSGLDFSSLDIPSLRERLQTLYSLVYLIVVGDECGMSMEKLELINSRILTKSDPRNEF